MRQYKPSQALSNTIQLKIHLTRMIHSVRHPDINTIDDQNFVAYISIYR